MTANDLKIFKDPPTLKTERLVLRKLTKKDVYDVFAYASREEVSRYLLWRPHRNIDESARYLKLLNKKYKNLTLYDWGIEYEGKIIGTVGFTRFCAGYTVGEIGYVISDLYRGREIAVEAAKRLIKFGFEELSLNRIEARYLIENKASQRVAEKCSMTHEGVLRKSIIVKGEPRDLGISAILKEEYFKLNK